VAAELQKYIVEEKIEAMVFGLPLNNEGEETDACRDIRSLGSTIQEKMHIEVAYEDERFSSRLGDAMGGDASRDEKAAMAILDTYIQKRKK
jgi:putative transcription antitermination factor YqgF